MQGELLSLPFRGTFAGRVQGVDEHFGETVSCRRGAIARKQYPRMDLVYVESRPVTGFWKPRVAGTAGDESPFDLATDLEGTSKSQGSFHFLRGHVFRNSADVTRYVVALLALQERPWWWEPMWVIFKVHVFAWNTWALEDLHWCCNLRKGTVIEYSVGVKSRTENVDEPFWTQIALSQLMRWSSRYDLPHDAESAPAVLVDDSDVALEQLEWVRTRLPGPIHEHASLWRAVVAAYCKLGDWEEAEAWIDSQPEGPMYTWLRMQVLLDRGEVAAAMALGLAQLQRSPLETRLVALQCHCIVESLRVGTGAPASPRVGAVSAEAYHDAMALSGRLVSMLRDQRRVAPEHSDLERVAVQALHDGLVVHATTLAAAGQLDLTLQLLTEALTLHDNTSASLTVDAVDMPIAARHYRYRFPWTRGRSLGAELSEFVGPRDSLAKYVCFALDAHGEDTYLVALLHFLKHADHDDHKRKAQVLELHSQGNKKAMLHHHVWECIGFMALAINANAHWVKSHQQASIRGGGLALSFRQWLQGAYTCFHVDDFDSCYYCLCMAIRCRPLDERNELLWVTIMFMCTTMDARGVKVTGSLVDDILTAFHQLQLVVPNVPASTFRWIKLLRFRHPSAVLVHDGAHL